MAASKTIAQWQAIIVAEVQAQPVLSAALTSTSLVAIWYLLTYVVAVVCWQLDSLYEAFKKDVAGTLALEKPHTLKWYATKALLFELGYTLVPDNDYYDNSLLTEAQVTAARVVKYSAVTEVPKGLRIKIATITAGDLAPLSTPQLDAFKDYMNRIKDAGIRLNFVNSAADRLVLSLGIYYDPLVLDNAGQRLDGTANTPVQDALNDFLKNQPFNGLFILSMLVDTLQQVDGVVIPHVIAAAANYGTLTPIPFSVEYLPDAGYMRIAPGDLTITFTPHEPI